MFLYMKETNNGTIVVGFIRAWCSIPNCSPFWVKTEAMNESCPLHIQKCKNSFHIGVNIQGNTLIHDDKANLCEYNFFCRISNNNVRDKKLENTWEIIPFYQQAAKLYLQRKKRPRPPSCGIAINILRLNFDGVSVGR